MANRERGEVALEIDGKTYTLVLDVDAICHLESLFSTGGREMFFPDILERINKNSVRHIRGMVWAALRRYHGELTLEQAGDLMQAAGGLAGFSAKLQALAETTRPDPEDKKAVGKTSRPRKAQVINAAGNGVNSTSHPDA